MTHPLSVMSQYHLLMFTSDFPPLKEIVGGEQIRPFELVSYWADRGGTGEVWCVRPALHRRDDWKQMRVRTVPFGRVARELLAFPLAVGVIIRAWWRFRRGGPRPVLYHRPSGLFWLKGVVPLVADVGCFLVPLCNLLGCITIGIAHDVAPDHEFGQARRRVESSWGARISRRDLRRIERAGRSTARFQRVFLGRSRITVVTSDQHKRILLSRIPALRADRVMVLQAAVNPKLLSVPTPKAVQKVRIGVVGSMFDANPQLLEAALQLLPVDHDFVVVHGGNDADAAHEFELPAHVSVLTRPRLRYGEFASLCEEVDVWMLVWGDDPYLLTISPLRVPLCLASGRPVITTPLAELTTAGLDSVCWVAPATANGLAGRVSDVLADLDVGTKTARARQTVLSSHTWAKRFDLLFAELDSQF